VGRLSDLPDWVDWMSDEFWHGVKWVKGNFFERMKIENFIRHISAIK
jgi:hypothetical protein